MGTGEAWDAQLKQGTAQMTLTLSAASVCQSSIAFQFSGQNATRCLRHLLCRLPCSWHYQPLLLLLHLAVAAFAPAPAIASQQ